ncbi:hypothetical protein GGH12_004307 [Coemansia sp. RSA 1822]|nr:hypothetical protein LPJ76_000405 [Coemansia sp. RSA 638]KAJ2542589.1 hypothetical protein GGF49_002735 [Coemansia sp. RSA 1853]KAJ2561065.1 hypothetical protein GGH12_004307 [Coemansia sp. RSA 1822]
MKLEEKLAKWVERPENDDEDDDYGLIIDDSVTTAGPPRAAPFPPQFTKAGSCSQLPGRPLLLSPSSLLPPNIRPLGRPVDAPLRPSARPSLSAQDVLQRYVEHADSENYDDLVLPEEAATLDKQLAQWKTPCRRLPSWPNDLVDEVTMSGATAVDTDSGSSKTSRAAERPITDPEDTPTMALAGTRRHAAAATPVNSSALRLPVSAPKSQLGPARSPPRKSPLRPPQHQQYQHRHLRRPMLIKNMPPVEPMVLGHMRFDPVSQTWIGNENEGERFAGAIAESERQMLTRSSPRTERLIDTNKLAHKISQRSGNLGLSPTLSDDMAIDPPESRPDPGDSRLAWHASATSSHRRRLSPTNPLIETAKGRPALIPPSAASLVESTANSASGGRARPIFDPQNLRWIDPNESKHDPFWNIAELPVEPSPIDAVHFTGRLRSASEAIGGDTGKTCFVLSDEQIEAYHRESIDYESFARHWFPKSAT